LEIRHKALIVPQALIVEEPEGFVAPAVHMRDDDGATHVPSELIANDLGHWSIHRVFAAARASDHRIVAVIFIGSKVQLVCAAARCHDNGGRIGEARVGPHGFDSKFLDCFNSWSHAHDPATETVDLRDAVQIDIQ
jgi:hypothetical protein